MLRLEVSLPLITRVAQMIRGGGALGTEHRLALHAVKVTKKSVISADVIDMKHTDTACNGSPSTQQRVPYRAAAEAVLGSMLAGFGIQWLSVRTVDLLFGVALHGFEHLPAFGVGARDQIALHNEGL